MHIWTAEDCLLVAAVMARFSRRIVDWSMIDTMETKMLANALPIAVWRLGRPAELIHLSDQGGRIPARNSSLEQDGITCIMSRRGECWDSAAMESLFSIRYNGAG